MIEFENLDNISISGASCLSVDDINVLSLLYAPLIKSSGYHLYMVFHSLLDRQNYKSSTYIYKELLDILSLTKREFSIARVKLEAIGLINTYKNGNEYIIMLKSPLTAKAFLSDGMLGMYLYSEIGDIAFKKLQSSFSIARINKTDFEEVTAYFDEVFTSSPVEVPTKNEYTEERRQNKGIRSIGFNFDFDYFVTLIPKTFLENGITDRFKTFMINIATAYEFSPAEMSDLFTSSLNSSGVFDYRLASKKAREMYKELHPECLPHLEEAKSLEKSEQEKGIERLTAKQICESLSTHHIATDNDIKNICDVYNEFEDYSKGFLNLAVIQSIKKCEGEIPAFNYYKKVLQDWISKDITTFDSALAYINDKQMLPTKKNNKKNNNKNDNPEWLNKYIENIEDGMESL